MNGMRLALALAASALPMLAVPVQAAPVAKVDQASWNSTKKVVQLPNGLKLAYVEAGHGFLPIHSASHSFRNSAKVVAMMGGQFDRHGVGTFTAPIVNASHPVMSGLQPFETWAREWWEMPRTVADGLAPISLGGDHSITYPIVRAFYISLWDWGIFGPDAFIGIGNYVDLANSDRFWNSFLTTVRFALIYVPMIMVVSVVLAALLHRKLPAIEIFRTAIFLPLVVNVAVASIAFKWLFEPQAGTINQILRLLHLPDQAWLSDPAWALGEIPAPPRAGEGWKGLVEMFGRLVRREAGWPVELGHARLWYEPLMEQVYTKFGLTFTFVDMRDVANVERALTPATRMVYCETPTNPMMALADLAAVGDLTQAHGYLYVVDNTFATPILQQPLALGADVVMHSTTKYFGGHSDVLGGALVFARREAMFDAVAHRRHITGGVLSPFSAWLTLRGCRSLPARMAMHCANARRLAEFLAGHAAVSRVNWPGLASHPGHAIATSQMRDYGAMLSVQVRGGREAALRVAGKLRLFTNATSLGGCESLVEHRASVEGANPVSPQDLLRVSVGLEHPDDLVADWAQALA